MLAQDGFAGFTVLHVKQNPVLQCAQKVIAFKERLHSKAVAFFRGLLPPRHVTAVRVPRHTVPVVQQMRHIEQLGCGQQFRGFQFISPKLLDGALDGITIFGVFMLHDGDGNTVDHEHHIGAVTLSCRWFNLPFPCDMKGVGLNIVEGNQRDGAVTFFSLVNPLPLTAQPRQHFAVSFDGGGERV